MATRGRKPKPRARKALDGNPGKRPLNEEEPRPRVRRAIAPAHLDDDAKREWRRVAKDLRACGLLTGIDRAALAAYCVAYSRWVAAENLLKKRGQKLVQKSPNGFMVPNPLLAISNKAMELMHKFATEFGMTPSARSRLTARSFEPTDTLADFLRKGR